MIHEHSTRFAILNIAKTPEEAEEMVKYLLSLNWHEIYAEQEARAKAYKDQEEREKEEIITNGGGYCDSCHDLTQYLLTFNHTVNQMGELLRLSKNERNKKLCLECMNRMEKHHFVDTDKWHGCCEECHKVLPRESLHRHPVVESRWDGYCQDCLNIYIQRYTRTCEVCGNQSLQRYFPLGICNECYNAYPYQTTISTHLKRAITANQPATLTLLEWIKTLKHFNFTCAYCGKRPYRDLEHYIPISLNAGTTFDNCLPSCNTCNRRKNDKHPEDFARLFPSDNIERINQWFNSIREEQS